MTVKGIKQLIKYSAKIGNQMKRYNTNSEKKGHKRREEALSVDNFLFASLHFMHRKTTHDWETQLLVSAIFQNLSNL